MYVLGLAYEISPWFCTETHPNLNVKTPFPPGEGVCVCVHHINSNTAKYKGSVMGIIWP